MSLDISDKDLHKKAKYLCGGVCTCDNKRLGEACDIIRVMARASDTHIKLAQKFLEHTHIPTRQSEFLKKYPNACSDEGVLRICPKDIDTNFECKDNGYYHDCRACRKTYWMEEALKK